MHVGHEDQLSNGLGGCVGLADPRATVLVEDPHHDRLARPVEVGAVCGRSAQDDGLNGSDPGHGGHATSTCGSRGAASISRFV